MLQKPSSVPLFCQNLTTVILFYQVFQNIFLTNSKRSKIRQPDLSSKLSSTNTSNPSFRNFTVYQQSQESSIKSQLCATILSLKVTQSIFLNSRLSTVHPDNFAPFLILEPSAYLSQKTKTFGQLAFSFTGPTEWNSLPYDVRHSVSNIFFQASLKNSSLQICI